MSFAPLTRLARRVPLAMLAVCLGLAGLCPPAALAAGETVLTIPGTGDSQDLLRLLAERFKRDNPDIRVELPDSIGSTAGMRLVVGGKAELARTARALRDDEIAAGLIQVVFAATPVVFAVHPLVTGVKGLSSAQVQAVFAGRVKNWSELGGPDLPVARVCRETPETSRELLNAAIPGFEADGCRDQAVAYTTPEAVALVAGHPGAIGYFSLAAMTATNLTPLALSGVAPTLESVGRGAYPVTIPFGLAYKPPLSPAAVRFLKFLSGPDAQSLMARLGCLPSPAKPAAP
ncbi:MAG: ABC-type phosphate transport system, periplasmic component [Solidesulfovibrio magneticus str. Maddingley MBC34]|uniref:ABC-type phosphate transport system, periplasmic component n=1 Tax=Solidesulfovibrio magneticus str. Maddingley MBC34 TaxID=1206767 RepID=K6GSE6_9BACT|nr:MAG: ABC-type phosphate transport system, periplasmic component [Solidesulfovibrio magneticus str. Maddingley MBC34]